MKINDPRLNTPLSDLDALLGNCAHDAIAARIGKDEPVQCPDCGTWFDSDLFKALTGGMNLLKSEDE